VQTGNVGNDLAHKFQQHIVLHHQHHGSISLDRYKRYIIVDNPAMVDQKKLAYVSLDDSKKPNMGRGFTFIKDGEPTMFLEGLTVWKHWLQSGVELELAQPKRGGAARKINAVAAEKAI